jgi:phosphoglucosamine mutase
VNPDGENINRDCGALYSDVLAEEVKRTGADFGVAIDGDGDRCILVDEKGNVIDGDHIMAISATALLREGKLNKKTLVATVMSNSGLDEAIAGQGGKVVRTSVGDRYVVEEMIRGGYNLGGEQSGHIVFFDHTTTGDGIITALQVLSRMVTEEKKLSELASSMESYPQVLVNVEVKQKPALEAIPSIVNALAGVRKKLKKKGRAFIRYSGTEPLARITVEGKNEDEINSLAGELAELVEKELG